MHRFAAAALIILLGAARLAAPARAGEYSGSKIGRPSFAMRGR